MSSNSNHLYKSPQERYADNRSSAFSFLVIGGAGLFVMVLVFAGVFRLPLHDFALFTMTALFAVFLIAGLISLQNAKKILDSVAAEHALIEEIKNWYSSDGIHDAALSAMEERFTDETEEERELQKYEMVRQILIGQFPEASEALLDKLASDFCEEEQV